MLVSILPQKLRYPMLPHHALRRCGSSSSMISIALTFGAPVIEPPGKAARSRSAACRWEGNLAVTVLTSDARQGRAPPQTVRAPGRYRERQPGQYRCALNRRSSGFRRGLLASSPALRLQRVLLRVGQPGSVPLIGSFEFRLAGAE